MLRNASLVVISVAISFSLLLQANAGMKLKEKEDFPAFSLESLSAGKGASQAKKSITLKQFKGKVVVIDFWASWCGPCRKELPGLNKLYKKYQKRGLEILGINLDDDKNNALGFLSSMPVDFKLASDSKKKLAEQCGLESMPSSFVLSRKGKIQFIHDGFTEEDLDRFEKEIVGLL